MDVNFTVKNSLSVNGSFVATTGSITLGSNLSITNTSITIGNTTANLFLTYSSVTVNNQLIITNQNIATNAGAMALQANPYGINISTTGANTNIIGKLNVSQAALFANSIGVTGYISTSNGISATSLAVYSGSNSSSFFYSGTATYLYDNIAGQNITTWSSNAAFNVTGTGGLNVTSGKTRLPASSSAGAPLNIPHGSAPSSPQNGDIWTTAGGLFCCINGSVQSGLAGEVPVGGVILWYGGPGTSIPSNWHILDGSTVQINGSSVTLPNMWNSFPFQTTPGATGGSSSQTPTIYGASLSTDQLPAHNHGIYDPGHAHSVADPGHAHGVNDPGHAHTYQLPTGQWNSGSTNKAVWNADYNGTFGTSASTTGISIAGAATGIGIYGATTGIQTYNTGSGNPHYHSASSISTIPPYVGFYFLIRIS